MDKNSFTGGAVSFFLGCSAPTGFFSLYDELYDPWDGWHLTVIKGGPGTGKSTLMKTLADSADKRGIYCERIYCSSDPLSLDAVIFPGLKKSICDGTLPHALEPRYPGISESLLDLGQFRDDRLLKAQRAEILEKFAQNAESHKRCRLFLRAAGGFERENRLIAAGALLTEKAEHFADRLCEKELGTLSAGKGKTLRRLLSAVTPLGIKTFHETVSLLCEKIFVLEDSFSPASSVILNRIITRASEKGYRLIVCLHPFLPDCDLQGIILPELSLAILTDSPFCRFQITCTKTVHCSRFYNGEDIGGSKNRLSFNRKLEERFLEQAAENLKIAGNEHDELEEYYKTAMDFDAVKAKAKETEKEFFGS